MTVRNQPGRSILGRKKGKAGSELISQQNGKNQGIKNSFALKEQV